MSSSRRLVGLATFLALAAAPSSAQTPTQADSAARAATRTNGLPLIATRTLRFTTEEATWISLDVSPDGKTIVFDVLGDLYTIPITGGKATRITSGAGWDQQPRYSPDGTQIAFVSDRNGSKNVWIANADGTRARALTKSERINFSSPIWSSDGQYVIAARTGQLWLFNKDGGTGTQLTGLRPEGAAAPAGGAPTPSHYGAAPASDPRFLWVNVSGTVPPVLANGTHAGLAASVEEELEEQAARSNARRLGQYQVAQFDRETGRTLIRTHETDGAFRPVASPDGKWLVYAVRHDAREALKLRDIATGEERWLVMDVQRDNSQGGGVNDRDLYPASAFTPDSKALITSYNGKIWRVEVPSGRVSAIPFSADVDQPMGPLAKFEYPINDSTLVVTQIRGARPSPDGTRVAFTALDALYVGELAPAAAGASATAPRTVRNPRRLTRGGMVEHAPVWSPDGRYLAYVTWTDTGGGHVYRVRSDGNAQPERLTRLAAYYDKIAYTKDGTRLFAVRGSRYSRMRMFEDFGSLSNAAELEYVWLPAAGGEPTRIAWVGGGQSQEGRNVPHVGPDSTRLYVWAGSEGLVSMRLDGTDRRVVVRVSGPPQPALPLPPGATPPPPPVPDEVVLSPDGKRAVVHADNNVYVITVPPVVGQASPVGVTSGSVVPTTRLTKVGGDFVGWSNDGRYAYYSIGRSFFQYDVRAAEVAVRDSIARADSIAAAGGTGGGTPGGAGAAGGGAAGGATGGNVPGAGGAANAAARDSTRKSTVAYEAQRHDVEITATKDKPRGTVVLRGARLVTMKGDEVIEGGDVVVTDNRIVAVGATGSVTVPAGARVIDVAGKTIIPGFVDIHAHNWFGWGVHRDQVTQLLANLAYGVTTQRDPQTSATDILTYTDLMETGALIGPRLYSTGPGIFSADNIKSLDEARDVVRRYSEYYNTRTIKQYLAGDRKVRQWVITAAREQGLTTTTEGGSNLSMNLTLMQDGYPGLEHAMPIFPLMGDVAQLAAQSGITYTPTLIVGYGGPTGLQYWLTHYNVDADAKLHRFTPHEELDSWKTLPYFREDQFIFTGHAQQLARIVNAGGRVGLGSHGELQGLGVHWELWMMQSGGLTTHQALRAATLHGADAIGLSRDLGSLEPGKLADLQVLDANPLADIHNTNTIRFVMKNGRLYDGDTLDEVWPRQKALGPQWWWREDPPAGR
ncbi:MAG: PD40 domain-containing protein [Gemmatimonadetes bacterium]|nr:PD40 domain-containing protein [Gemmatimonadota bacterium]